MGASSCVYSDRLSRAATTLLMTMPSESETVAPRREPELEVMSGADVLAGNNASFCGEDRR
jgi:hypothetical protein